MSEIGYIDHADDQRHYLVTANGDRELITEQEAERVRDAHLALADAERAKAECVRELTGLYAQLEAKYSITTK